MDDLVLVIVDAEIDSSPSAHEHLIMPRQIANIIKNYIKKHPENEIDIEDDFQITFDRFKVKIIDNVKIINAFKKINKYIETSSLSIIQAVLGTMDIRDKEYDICPWSSNLTKNDYKCILKNKHKLE